MHFGQCALRDFEQRAEFFIPAQLADVEEECATRVGKVGGKNFTAHEPVNEIRVNRSDDRVATFELRSDGRLVFDEPADFRRGEISVNFQSGLAQSRFRMALLGELGTDGIAADACRTTICSSVSSTLTAAHTVHLTSMSYLNQQMTVAAPT